MSRACTPSEKFITVTGIRGLKDEVDVDGSLSALRCTVR